MNSFAVWTTLMTALKWPARKAGTPLLLALAAFGVTGCSNMSRDAEALRDSLMTTAATEWNKEVEIGVGAITLSLARAGLSFVELDADARAALDAVRGAEVGVYHLQRGRQRLDPPALLAAADETMTARGWDRLVIVLGRHGLVAIYVPKEIKSPRHMKVCLAVLNERELVVVSAESNLEPLLEMASRHSERLPHTRLP
ncbi:MAG: hypothetical protein HYY24_14025 [Verrucomicrobia bacterium]|nr:hypothetical protein [Verrucomicrobiota bacterium]